MEGWYDAAVCGLVREVGGAGVQYHVSLRLGCAPRCDRGVLPRSAERGALVHGPRGRGACVSCIRDRSRGRTASIRTRDPAPPRRAPRRTRGGPGPRSPRPHADRVRNDHNRLQPPARNPARPACQMLVLTIFYKLIRYFARWKMLPDVSRNIQAIDPIIRNCVCGLRPTPSCPRVQRRERETFHTSVDQTPKVPKQSEPPYGIPGKKTPGGAGTHIYMYKVHVLYMTTT